MVNYQSGVPDGKSRHVAKNIKVKQIKNLFSNISCNNWLSLYENNTNRK